ncbi:MAG: aldo/keto reductase [Bryobacteraceae bacterium]
MQLDFSHATLGRLPNRVLRLGMSASYRPGETAVRRAIDLGVGCFFLYGFDSQMVRALRDLPSSGRERLVIATGAYNLIWTRQNFRRTLEKRLRQLRTDYLDVFLYLGVMKPGDLDERALDELSSIRQDPRVRAVGMSCHDRRFAAEMSRRGALDTLMIRYNAAHRGAETEIFPSIDGQRTGVISYTATRWTALLRKSPNWAGPVPDAGLCYRFALSHPSVDVCLTAPRSERELEDNVRALERGPLNEDELRFMREFGDAVHARQKWFM